MVYYLWFLFFSESGDTLDSNVLVGRVKLITGQWSYQRSYREDIQYMKPVVQVSNSKIMVIITL